MIEFSGLLSDECKLHSAKLKSRNSGLWFLLFSIILSIIVMIIGILYNSWIYPTVLILVLSILTLLIFSTPSKRISKIKIYCKITISEDSISMIYNNQTCKNKRLNDIKQVIDYGDWFYIIFKWGDISNSWICEKRLIKTGTIEEFKELFKDKIVVKQQKG